MTVQQWKNQTELRLPATAEIQLAEGQQATSAKLSILAYNGLELSLPGLGPFIIDLSGMGLGGNIPILADHNNSLGSLVGHGTAEIKANKLHVSAVANGVTENSKTVIELARGGVPLQASVGISMVKRQFLSAGDSAQVNGRTVRAGAEGLMLVRKSTLNEVSVTPLGVDGQTSVSIAAKRETKMIETDNEVLTLAQKQAREDFLKIEELCDGLEFQNDMSSRVKALKLSAIKGEINREDLLAGIVKLQQDDLKLSKTTGGRPQGPAIHSSTRDASNDVLEAALCLSLNLPKVEKLYDEKTLDLAHKNFRHIGLQETIELAAQANGYQGRGCRTDLETVLLYAFPSPQMRLSSGPSSISLPNILGAVANKELLAGFTEEDQTWKEIAATKPVSNFHTWTSYRLLDDMEYEQISSDGGIMSHGRIDEQQVYTRSADTYAKMFALTRKQIINDDLGALDNLRTRLGRGAAKKFNNLFWQTFLTNADGTSDAIFTAANNNYITGSTTTLLVDGVGLEAAILKFDQMKSPSPEDGTPGKRIGGEPVKLLHPPEVRFAAERLYVSQNLVGGSTASPESNIHYNRYRPVKVPFLSDSAFTGYSTTAWGIFRDPGQYACLVVSFLNGQQTPTVESTTADFHTLGILFRGYHDFGIDPAEIYGGVWSKGAS